VRLATQGGLVKRCPLRDKLQTPVVSFFDRTQLCRNDLQPPWQGRRLLCQQDLYATVIMLTEVEIKEQYPHFRNRTTIRQAPLLA